MHDPVEACPVCGLETPDVIGHVFYKHLAVSKPPRAYVCCFTYFHMNEHGRLAFALHLGGEDLGLHLLRNGLGVERNG